MRSTTIYFRLRPSAWSIRIFPAVRAKLSCGGAECPSRGMGKNAARSRQSELPLGVTSRHFGKTARCPLSPRADIPIAIVLDLMEPVGADRDVGGLGREAELKHLEHAPKIGRRGRFCEIETTLGAAGEDYS